MDLKTLYPATVNSQATTTLGALNAETVTIEVLDAAVLPDAPNLLVLGTDQTAETVLMTEKNGNTLTVERGIQGNAIAWPAGTQVARNFTAKDWDDLVENVTIIVAKIMSLKAADVGALSNTTKATDIGGAAAEHKHSAAEVGALPADGSEPTTGPLQYNDGTTIHDYYGTHNITKGTASLTAGTSALGAGCIYLQYE